MKFGRTLRENTLNEWRYYSVNYKKLKQSLKNGELDKFEAILEESKTNIGKFYTSKENWAMEYLEQLKVHVEKLTEVAQKNMDAKSEKNSDEVDNDSSDDESSDEEEENELGDKKIATSAWKSHEVEDLKIRMRSIAECEHFKAYIYCKKSLDTFHREIQLLLDFLELNFTAFGKILKKYDKVQSTDYRESKLAAIQKTHAFLNINNTPLLDVKESVEDLLNTTKLHKPTLPSGWEQRKVYTIGCFDLFHRGHQNVLNSLREFGYFIVAGIHDDESYFKLKNKYTIDNLEKRIQMVKPFVDQLFVIPSTDPLIYIQAAVSQQDIDAGSCCYVRGDDMLQFPGREWVESVMPVYFVPRTESCSSTLIRTIYHSEGDLAKQAAFAKTRYDGKPIDAETGEVLKLKK